MYVFLAAMVSFSLLTIVYIVFKPITIITVSGSSMLPSLKTGDKVFVLRWGRRALVRKNRIAVFSPHRADRDGSAIGTYSVKRIVGLSGDKFERIIPPIIESMIRYGCSMPETEWIVQDNQVFALGDNGANSYDSREVGPINIKQIWGIVICKVPDFNQYFRRVNK